MRKHYFVYYPSSEGNIVEEWEQCLKKIEKCILLKYKAVKLNVFADLPDYYSFLSFRATVLKSVNDFFGNDCPALNITVHPPERPWKISVEITCVLSDKVIIKGKKFRDFPYLLLKYDSVSELWAGGISSYRYPDNTQLAAVDAFEIMASILRKEKFSFNHLVRQWNYIGNILQVRNGFQNYQIFNEVRNDYYSKYRTINGFPAATGVGMKFGDVILDFCAIRSDDPLNIKAIDNPEQVNAYEYGQQVLIGAAERDRSVKNPPKFERALMIVNKAGAHLHISGTASILGQDTEGKGNIEKQTLITIGNIKNLADTKRLGRLLTDKSLGEEFFLLRVYIKCRSDFQVVRQICSSHFPEVPIIYLEADICRDDLLMEIEAEVGLNPGERITRSFAAGIEGK